MRLGSANIKVEVTGRDGCRVRIGGNGEFEGTIGQRSCLVKLPEKKKLCFQMMKAVTSLGAKLYFVIWRWFRLCL